MQWWTAMERRTRAHLSARARKSARAHFGDSAEHVIEWEAFYDPLKRTATHSYSKRNGSKGRTKENFSFFFFKAAWAKVRLLGQSAAEKFVYLMTSFVLIWFVRHLFWFDLISAARSGNKCTRLAILDPSLNSLTKWRLFVTANYQVMATFLQTYLTNSEFLRKFFLADLQK